MATSIAEFWRGRRTSNVAGLGARSESGRRRRAPGRRGRGDGARRVGSPGARGAVEGSYATVEAAGAVRPSRVVVADGDFVRGGSRRRRRRGAAWAAIKYGRDGALLTVGRAAYCAAYSSPRRRRVVGPVGVAGLEAPRPGTSMSGGGGGVDAPAASPANVLN